jgi:hypothetical protein
MRSARYLMISSLAVLLAGCAETGVFCAGNDVLMGSPATVSWLVANDRPALEAIVTNNEGRAAAGCR